jgi:pyruvate kinase
MRTELASSEFLASTRHRLRNRKTRIVGTLGPASRQPEQVKRLALAGVDVFRINFSHGSHDDHALAIEAVRAAEEDLARPLAVLADLQGPKFRLGCFLDGHVLLGEGQTFRLDLDPTPGDKSRVCLPHPEIFAAVSAGAMILLDDGRVRLEVLRSAADHALTVVVAGAELSDRKGVNLPGNSIPIPALTEKDRKDLAFALDRGVDWVALSFVQQAQDMAELRRLVDGRAAVLAKIEKPAALGRLDEILDLSNAIMVARGDLGVELGPQQVPVVQKRLVRAARERGIPVIVATQMLESMTVSPAPTRAEVSDVANAVYEGADAVMLSAETAAGRYPMEAVQMMDSVIRSVEQDERWLDLIRAEHSSDDESSLVGAAVRSAQQSGNSCIAVFTATGRTALQLSRERGGTSIVALSPFIATARRLALAWGVECRLVEDVRSSERMAEIACAVTAAAEAAPPGGRVFVLAGLPMGSPGKANVLRMVQLPGVPA